MWGGRERVFFISFSSTQGEISQGIQYFQVSQPQKHSMSWCKSLQITSEVTPTERQTYLHFGEKTFLIETKIHYIHTQTLRDNATQIVHDEFVLISLLKEKQKQSIVRYKWLEVLLQQDWKAQDSDAIHCVPSPFLLFTLHSDIIHSLPTNGEKKLSSCCR